ncbi:MAG: chitobiase/beta-hexosaminidase C-terminal domain-containing protein [Verrucomicrobiota bacterium]
MFRAFLLPLLALGFALTGAEVRAETNVALHKPSSGDETAGFPASHGNDGSTVTFTQAINPKPAPGNPFWMVDLQGAHDLTRVELVDRIGCCAPNRLNGAVIRLFDGGEEPVGAPIPVNGLPDNNPEATATQSWNNGGAGWKGVAFVRIDGVSADFQFSEFRAFSDGVPPEGESLNIAAGRPVTATGATYPGYPAENIADGDSSTFTHPEVSASQGFYFQVDLGSERLLDRIVIRNRSDGCCPERLTKYQVAVLNAPAGPPVWSANVRADGSNSGVAGEDILRAAAGTGTFSGRYVRITNSAATAYGPQLAELEVYSPGLPVITSFRTGPGNITAGGNAALPAETTLHWAVGNFTSLSISPGVGAVDGASGSVTVKPSVTTTYTLTAVNGAGTSTATVRLGVDEPQLPPVLTEFLADNTRSLKDARGDRADWVEIHNPNAFSISLAGFFLTDSAASPAKWRFPALIVPAEGYLVVFADGQDRLDAVSGEAHTNFSLTRNGEYLALTAKDGVTPLNRFPKNWPAVPNPPEQGTDISYGNVGNTEGFFAVPTPGAPNGDASSGFVKAVEVSAGRGFYDTAQSVTLSCATPGAVIRYTTNRSEPTAATGTAYTAPVAVTTTTVLRAAAFVPDWIPSPAATHTYIFPEAVAVSSVMRTAVSQNATYAPQMRGGLTGLPSFSLVTPGTVNGNTEVKTSLEFLSPAGETQFQEYCGVKHFGGAFTDFPKKNFRLFFGPEYGVTKLRQPLFEGRGRGGVPVADSFDQLELRSGSHDMKQRGFYLSNTFTDDTMLDMGNINPHGRYAHLYLNGVYHGLYHLRERWQGDMLSDYLGGEKDDYEAINGNWNVGGWAEPGTPYDGDGSVWERVKSLRGDYAEVRRWLDVRSYVDFMLMFMFGDSEDEYRCAGPVTPDVGLQWFLNDADGFTRSVGSRTGRGAPGRQSGDGPGSIFSMLVKQAHPEFKMLLADRIHALFFNDGPMTRTRNTARLQARITEIEAAMIPETARWGGAGDNDSWPLPSNWTSAKNSYLNNVLSSRTTSVINEYRTAGFYPPVAAPVFTPHGGNVTAGEAVGVSIPAGTVYFTVDGGDPRMPDGTVSSSALTHNAASPPAALMFTQNTWLRARTRTGSGVTTVWSALNEAFYTVGGSSPVAAGDIVLSELHYHPVEGGGGEFIEFHNVTGHAVNLRGARFTAGIRHVFSDTFDTVLPADQRLVIVRDLLSFRRVHGPGPRVTGIFTDGLSSAGDTLTLVSAAGAPLLNVAYLPGGLWPASPDGGGPSLVFTGGDPVNPLNWRAGTLPEGSPLEDDSVPFTGVPGADANGNGVPDLIDHAAGPDKPALTLERSPEGVITALCPRAAGVDDVVLTFEESADATTWRDATALYLLSARTSAIGGELLHFHRTGPPAGPRLFVRRRAALR